MTYQLFSTVILTEDIPEYGLTCGQTGVVVEYYTMPGDQENGYSIEGLIDGNTVEVKESQIQKYRKLVHIKSADCTKMEQNSQNSNREEIRKKRSKNRKNKNPQNEEIKNKNLDI